MVAALVGLIDVVASSVSIGLAVLDADGRTVWANDALRELVGNQERGERSALTDFAARPDDHPVQKLWSAPDARRVWLQVTCRPLPGADGDLLLYEVTDITRRREDADEAVLRERRLSRVQALARVGTWDWDLATNVVVWSDELLLMFGLGPGMALDYPEYRSLLHPDDVALIERTLAEALETTQPFSYTHRMYLADRRTERVFECYGEVVTDEEGRPARVLGTAHDVTEQRRITAELAYLADHDALTGLPNRRSVTAHLAAQLTRGQGGALLLIDVDNFKDINDLRGHAVGDQVMRTLAQLLRDAADETAVLGRLGGDEFAVVLCEGDSADALAAAEALCRAVAARPVVAGGTALRVTTSTGVAPLERGGDSEVVLANADLALYEAKAAGRNRVRLYAHEQYRHAAQRVSLLQRVQRALDGGTMSMDAQPIIDLASATVVSHELLIRMRDGLDPAVGPADFLPAVERTDLVLTLDRWVLERAVAALATPGARRAGLCLSINVSSRSVEDASFGDTVVDTLRTAGVEPARLSLEITETAALTSLDAARHLAQRLVGAGCHFVLDDFGAGFGSFVYLKHLPFTSVKIAGEFVRQADQPGADRVLVDAVVRAARGLGMRTVAEYVDREPLVSALRELGVDSGQGFHLGRPRPLSALLDSLGA